jgi:hypothetical protein
LPTRWARAVRWYRCASRECRPRSTLGVIVAELLDELRRVESVAGLRERYWNDDGSWIRGVAAALLSATLPGADLQRVEEVAYGLRWVEVTCGIEVDLSHSLIRQVPVALLE